MLGDLDAKAVRRSLRTIEAALRLRGYDEWEPEVVNDEGRVLGMTTAGFSENRRLSSEAAREAVRGALEQVLRRIAILRAQAEAEEIGQATHVQEAQSALSVSIQPGTAFIIMAIDPNQHGLEDVKRTIQEGCARFNIRAVRADDIEHSEEITHRILEAIRTSEFLIADLSDERPSVYYEVGYAHAIGKRPILFRKAGTRLHFDLAVHSCPEYTNLTDLKDKLHRRLAAMTGLGRSAGEG
jgi:nucleoside 2-deoxyribosyltransferase